MHLDPPRAALAALSAIVLTLGAACGSPAAYQGFEDGEPCGPCGLGVYTYQAPARCVSPMEDAMGALEINDACEGPQAQAIFVDVERGQDDPQGGGKDAPLRSLPLAMDLARTRGAKAVILRGDPTLTLPGPLVLPDGVHLYGGYTRAAYSSASGQAQTDWYYDPDVRPTLIVPASADGPTLGIDAVDLDRPIILANLILRTQDAPRENIALRALRARALVLSHVTVEAGAAGAGAPGAPGAPGADGEVGRSGGVGEAHLPGGPGLNPACPGAQGGQGGSGQIKTSQETVAASAGQPSPAAAQGGAPREAGADGVTPPAGASGQSAALGQLRDGRWIEGAAAQSGRPGPDGQGGGGGGGGQVSGVTGRGGGGGGGGAGGCGGQGGGAGGSGYPSIALLVEGSVVTLAAATTLRAGRGGDAGKGGPGGPGGAGKRGGVGGAGTEIDALGARGGSGADGASGGPGGDGVAGPSYAAYCIAQGQLAARGADNRLQAGQGGREVDGVTRAEAQEARGCALGQ